MWSEQPFEHVLKKGLDTLPEPAKTDLFSDYSAARRFVVEDIAGYISKVEPDLTDHSATHLADVMGRARFLIGESSYFSPYELYLLAVSILFHDVGNLHGRKEHQNKIAGVYDYLRKREPRFCTERTAVLTIAGAHTGAAKDGSKDTLRELDRLSFQAQSIRAREIAAVLRLADELAEGPQRTSAYLQHHGMYEPDSRVFHKYAAISEYCIERSDGRIAITYNIDVEKGASELQSGTIPLTELLKFSYLRITKLDQERRYCKHYCDLLSVFKETWGWFNFFYEGQKLDLNLKPIVISDLVVPGEPAKRVEDIDERYDIPALMTTLEAVARRDS